MSLRSALPPIALAVVVLVAGCAGVFGASSTQSSPTHSSPPTRPDSGTPRGPTASARTIQVSATGQVKATPDTVVLQVSVTATAPTASAARRRLARNVSRMKDALAGMGIGDDQITTAFFTIERDREYGPREREGSVPFRAQHVFAITLTNTSRVGEVIVTAVENGATGIEDVEFVLSRETRRRLRHKALGKAMTNARREAAILARNANLRLAGVVSVRTAAVGFGLDEAEAVAMSAAAGSATTIEAGTITVTARVQVTYNATSTAG